MQLSSIYNSNKKKLLQETDFYMHAHLNNHARKDSICMQLTMQEPRSLIQGDLRIIQTLLSKYAEITTFILFCYLFIMNNIQY